MEFTSTASQKQTETEINSLLVLNQPFSRRGIKHDNPGGGQRCVFAFVCGGVLCVIIRCVSEIWSTAWIIQLSENMCTGVVFGNYSLI